MAGSAYRHIRLVIIVDVHRRQFLAHDFYRGYKSRLDTLILVKPSNSLAYEVRINALFMLRVQKKVELERRLLRRLNPRQTSAFTIMPEAGETHPNISGIVIAKMQ